MTVVVAASVGTGRGALVVAPIRVICTSSFGSTVLSPLTVITIGPLVAPAGIVSVPMGVAKSFPAVAVLPAVSYVIITGCEIADACAFRLTVKFIGVEPGPSPSNWEEGEGALILAVSVSLSLIVPVPSAEVICTGEVVVGGIDPALALINEMLKVSDSS